MKKHPPAKVTEAATRFFRVRSLVRTQLAAGKRLDPYLWLRIETLAYIREKKPTMSELAQYLAITAPSASSLVASLAKQGLVKQERSREDRRSLSVSLTPRGRRVLEGAFARGQQVFGYLFAPLSAAELAAFTRLLAKIERGSV